MILGIDEAGRGPVIGPLVLCGVRIRQEQEPELIELGVKDSKAFGSGQRARQARAALSREIQKIATVDLRVADAEEVDRWVSQGGLNRLEVQLASHILQEGPPVIRAVADGERLFAPLRARWPQLEARDRADRLHPVVAAASVVAKAERDRRLEQLLAPHEAYLGPIGGGGYPNAATARFLCEYLRRYRCLPPGVRRTWSWSLLRQFARIDEGVMLRQAATS